MVQECEIWVTSTKQTPNPNDFPLTLRPSNSFGQSCLELLFYFETLNVSLRCGSARLLQLFVRLWPANCVSPTPSNITKTRSGLSPSPSLSLSFPSFHLIKAHGLSPLFTKYSLTKKKWEFLLIEDQSGKVSSSNPALSIRAP